MTFDPVWEEIFRSQGWGKYPGEELIVQQLDLP